MCGGFCIRQNGIAKTVFGFINTKRATRRYEKHNNT
jgi:hypothetical protein